MKKVITLPECRRGLGPIVLSPLEPNMYVKSGSDLYQLHQGYTYEFFPVLSLPAVLGLPELWKWERITEPKIEKAEGR